MVSFLIPLGDIVVMDDLSKDMQEAINDAPNSGAQDFVVDKLITEFNIHTDDPDGVRAHLKGYGAWDDNDLQDAKENLRRCVWIMINDLKDQGEAYFGE